MPSDPADRRDAGEPPDPGRPNPDQPPPDGVAPATLRFPDLPRLELDQLLGQLVERAQEVMGTQGRLRALLRANHAITGELDLPTVLRRTAAAARELVGAGHAALAVARSDGGVAEVVHTGLPEDVVERIRVGRLPEEGALSAPVAVRGEVFGHLHLVASERDGFTAEDGELLGALATTAGGAIDNARLYEQARARGEWLQASAAVTRQLLSADPDAGVDPLQLIAERMLDIARADLVTVLLPDERPGGTGRLAVEVGVGADADALRGRQFPVEGSLAGEVLAIGRPALVAQLGDGIGLSAMASHGVRIGPTLAVPLLGSRRVQGVLLAARLAGRPAFTQADLDMASSFANHAALAIELAQARAQQQRALMLGDRERIAADLHDHVIQRLFAAGLTLQSVAGGMGGGPGAARLLATIEDLDETIRQIRSTIFQLQREPGTEEEGGIRNRLLDVVAEVGPALGFDPDLRFSGLLTEALPPDLVDDLVAVLREALTNVARHAAARSAEVELTATADRVTLRVTDDGRGIGTPVRRSGLANLRRRAETHGGNFDVGDVEPTGTGLCWSVPIG